MVNLYEPTPYERYILARAAACGYRNDKELAYALGISPATLRRRLRGETPWTIQECRAMFRVLRLSFGDWIMLSLCHVSPFDVEYNLAAHCLFDGIDWTGKEEDEEDEEDDDDPKK